jgi:hypothetical protein
LIYTWYRIRESLLSLAACASTRSGVQNGGYSRELIVNLTTIPSRINRIHLAIESLLRQTAPPNRIILWVGATGSAPMLPPRLSRLTERGLEIRPCKDVGPHTKIWHALQAFPEACHVTADDDHFYPRNWLEALTDCWKRTPHVIIAGRAKRLPALKGPAIPAYRAWKFAAPGEGPSIQLLPLNYGGTVYAPGTLHDEFFNQEAMLRLCPQADDIWMKCMSLLQGTLVMRVEDEFRDLRMVTGTQRVSLHKSNVDADMNVKQFMDTVEAYGLQTVLKGEREETLPSRNFPGSQI